MAKRKVEGIDLDLSEPIEKITKMRDLESILDECDKACRSLERHGLRLAGSLSDLKRLYGELQKHHGRKEIEPSEKLEKLKKALDAWVGMYHAIRATLSGNEFDEADFSQRYETFSRLLKEIGDYHSKSDEETVDIDPADVDNSDLEGIEVLSSSEEPVSVVPSAPEPVVATPSKSEKEKKQEVLIFDRKGQLTVELGGEKKTFDLNITSLILKWREVQDIDTQVVQHFQYFREGSDTLESADAEFYIFYSKKNQVIKKIQYRADKDNREEKTTGEIGNVEDLARQLAEIKYLIIQKISGRDSEPTKEVKVIENFAGGRYEGELTGVGLPHGQGRWTFAGGIFEGEFKHGLPYRSKKEMMNNPEFGDLVRISGDKKGEPVLELADSSLSWVDPEPKNKNFAVLPKEIVDKLLTYLGMKRDTTSTPESKPVETTPAGSSAEPVTTTSEPVPTVPGTPEPVASTPTVLDSTPAVTEPTPVSTIIEPTPEPISEPAPEPEADSEKFELLQWEKFGKRKFYVGQEISFTNKSKYTGKGLIVSIDKAGDFMEVMLENGEKVAVLDDNEVGKTIGEMEDEERIEILGRMSRQNSREGKHDFLMALKEAISVEAVSLDKYREYVEAFAEYFAQKHGLKNKKDFIEETMAEIERSARSMANFRAGQKRKEEEKRAKQEEIKKKKSTESRSTSGERAISATTPVTERPTVPTVVTTGSASVGTGRSTVRAGGGGGGPRPVEATPTKEPKEKSKTEFLFNGEPIKVGDEFVYADSTLEFAELKVLGTKDKKIEIEFTKKDGTKIKKIIDENKWDEISVSLNRKKEDGIDKKVDEIVGGVTPGSGRQEKKKDKKLSFLGKIAQSKWGRRLGLAGAVVGAGAWFSGGDVGARREQEPQKQISPVEQPKHIRKSLFTIEEMMRDISDRKRVETNPEGAKIRIKLKAYLEALNLEIQAKGITDQNQIDQIIKDWLGLLPMEERLLFRRIDEGMIEATGHGLVIGTSEGKRYLWIPDYTFSVRDSRLYCRSVEDGTEKEVEITLDKGEFKIEPIE